MLKNKFTNWLSFCLFNLIWITPAVSQTISGVTFAPAEVCAGVPVDVYFNATGFPTGTLFTVELSEEDGVFSNSPSIKFSGTSSPLKLFTNGDAVGNYKIRVVALSKIGVAANTLKIKQSPAPPILSRTSVAICEGSNQAINLGQYVQGDSLTWYIRGTMMNDTIKAQSVALPPNPLLLSRSYYISQTVNGCESPRALLNGGTVSLFVVDPPLPDSVITYCQNSDASTLPYPGGESTDWFTTDEEGKGIPLRRNFIPSTENIGETYYYRNKFLTCETPGKKREAIKIAVVDKSAPPKIDVSDICVGSTAPDISTFVTGANLKWYDSSDGEAITKPVIVTTAALIKDYWVTQTETGKCESAKVKVTIVVKQTAKPTPETLVQYCQGENSKPLTAVGTGLKWYDKDKKLLTIAPTPETKVVGDVTFYVAQTLNDCVSELVPIIVRVKPVPSAPDTKDLAAVCEETKITSAVILGGVTKATGTLKWYNSLTDNNAKNAPGDYIAEKGKDKKLFYVSQTVNSCESKKDSILLPVKALPAAPKVVAPIVEYCQDAKDAVALTAEKTPSTNTLKWYDDKGAILSAAPVPLTNKDASYSVAQLQTYKIGTQTLICESAPSAIKVKINPLPGQPSTSNIVECQTKTAETFTLNATPSSGNTLKWYENNTVSTSLSGAPVIDKSKVVESSYFVTQVTAKNCESKTRKEVKVRIKLLPGAPGVATVEKCQFDTPEPLSATPVNGAALRWWGGNETGGTVSTNPPTPNYEKGESSKYFVSQILEGCESDRAKIDVVVKTTPVPLVATPNYTYCQNENATTLTAQGQRLTWYFGTQSGPDTFAPPTGNIGTVSYYVAQTGDNGCISPKAEIKVTVNPKPSSVMSGTQSVELGQPADIKIDFTGGGPWEYVLSDDTEGVAETSPLILKKTPQQTTTYSVKEVKNVCGLGTPNGSALVTVLIPAINTGNPAIANICADKSFTIPFQASAISVDTYEYKLQISKDTKDENFVSIPTTVVRNSSNATGIIPDTTSGGDYYIRLIVESPYYETPVKGSISQVSLTVMPLPVATVTGSKTILVGESAVVQIDFSGSGPWHFAMSDNEELTTTSLTPYYKTVTPATTTTYQVLSVQNECGAGRIEGEARIQVDPILSNEPQPSAGDWLKVFPVPVDLNLTVQIEKNYLQGTVTISVLDMMGRPVRSQKTDHTVTEVDFAQLPGGVYFVKVENGDLSSVTKVLKY